MSLVGTRPPTVDEWDKAISEYQQEIQIFQLSHLTLNW